MNGSCQRCYKKTNRTTMSMFNEEMICMECKDKEKKRPDYKLAVDTEMAEVKRGNLNFKGIGLK
jgi:hypothetical protein